MELPVIQTFNLARRFGEIVAVDGVNLNVPPGSVYGFLGHNGAGKTTTIRLLLGLIRPTAGEIRLFGQPLTKQRLSLLRHVGALVESPSLYAHLTGYENLEVTRRLIGADGAQVERALFIVRLNHAAGRLVRGYSQGMRQRLGLALALLAEPQLLILDEPTNGLDPAGIHEMRDLIRSLPVQHGITVFLSSHLLGEVEQVASHIGIIHQGRLMFEGTLGELQAQRQQRLVLGVSRPAEAASVLLQSGWQAQPIEDGNLVIVKAAREDAIRINRLLIGLGFEVFHLCLEQPKLEETFLSMTGPAAPEGDLS